MKNIVLCSDGTGNTTIKDRGTNVFKLFEAVDLRMQPGGEAIRQVAFYDDGVGTEKLKPLKILGGAVGLGLSRNIRDLYREVVRVYDPGDRIYLFGFSRGAYTVRALAGLIAHSGILDRDAAGSDAELTRRVKLAYSEFRKCFRRFNVDGDAAADAGAAEFRRKYSIPHEPVIEFVGVWDTVDALGFPVDEAADFWNAVVYPFRFPDRRLSRIVKQARHALAVDDERETFHPVMWEHDPRVRQVWFAGAHSNVGGGYPKQGMSLVSLRWMMEEAEKAGLRFLPEVRDLYWALANENDFLYDSRSGLAAYYRYRPRDIGQICAAHGERPVVHVSLLRRVALGTDAYGPGNLPSSFAIECDDSNDSTAAALRRKIESAAGGRSLLERSSAWVAARRWLHVAFVVLSLAAILVMAAGAGGWKPAGFSGLALMVAAGRGILALLSGDGWENAFRSLAPLWWLWGTLLVIYALSFWCARKTQRIYSEHWFPIRAELRRILWEKAKGTGA